MDASPSRGQAGPGRKASHECNTTPLICGQVNDFHEGTGVGAQFQPGRFRAVFLSDIHLGTRTSQAEPLLDFLKAVEADTWMADWAIVTPPNDQPT